MRESFDLLIRGGVVATPNGIAPADVGVIGGRIAAIGSLASAAAEEIFEAKGLHVLPGVMDTQVHFREPGNAHKEDLASGSLSLIESRASGIWNVAGKNPNLNRLAFAHLVARHCQLDASLIDPVLTSDMKQPAKRPLHGGLDIGKAISSLDWHPKDLDQIGWEAYLHELSPT